MSEHTKRCIGPYAATWAAAIAVSLASVPLLVKNDFLSRPGVMWASFSARSACGWFA